MYDAYVKKSHDLHLSLEEEIELIERYQQFNKIEDQELLLIQYIRAVLKQAAKFKKSYENNAILSKEDFINAGVMGLFNAIDRYDASKRNGGVPASYFFNHIRKEMQILKQKNLDMVYPIKMIRKKDGLANEKSVVSYHNLTSEGDEYQNTIPGEEIDLNTNLNIEKAMELIMTNLSEEEAFMIKSYQEEKNIEEASKEYSEIFLNDSEMSLQNFYHKRKKFFDKLKNKLTNNGIDLLDCI